MNFYKLIFRSLWHYRRQGLTVALGMAIGMAVITGALVTGDSVRSGLQRLVGVRLGNADLSVTSGDRYLTDSLAIRMSADLGIPAASVLQLQGSATADGGTIRLPKVQLYGIDSGFSQVLGEGTFSAPEGENEAVISDNLASRLNVQAGDEVLIRINKPGPVPIDAPFVSSEENIISLRVTVKTIAGREDHGRFHLQNTQTAPYNIFISKKHLQKLAGLDGYSNLILLSGSGTISSGEVENSLNSNRTFGDAGLDLRKHPVTGEWIVRTPRVFFDLPTLHAIESIPSDKSLWFSYFVNEFTVGSRSTPYSFVSTLPGDQVGEQEILINRWLAEDLNAKTGDSVILSYYMVGPLRSLTVEKASFRITGIIEMDDPRSDLLLMPEIPGLSDAGNCRDWETSIPIDLEKIRDKDEQYWNQYKGTPKAFIHPAAAARMWQNRFGKYTQVRFPAETKPVLITGGVLGNLRPADTGIRVQESTRAGLEAASSGIDFSGLFLGLSFFLIAGGIILTTLLIRLGLESRANQVGSLRAMGWSAQQIRKMLLLENGLVAIIGTILGLAVTIIYSALIFKALNGVWNSIVLTDTLRPQFKPGTLLLGMAISLIVSMAAAWIGLNAFFKHRAIELLKRSKKTNSLRNRRLLEILAGAAGFATVVLVIYGVVKIRTVSPVFFFLAGTLMLLSLILAAIRLVRYTSPAGSRRFSLGTLGRSNLHRNSSRSISVILLFAIGIFMVMAIGAYRLGPGEIGTGGFQYFLETTVPVPDNLNNPAVRSKYGLEIASEFVQLKKLAGDDASCLNLNRVSTPPLLGVRAGSFEQRFLFTALENKDFQGDPWKILETDMPGGVIPAIADLTVIQWGLGRKIGDTLNYLAENGDTVRIVLAGGLANSVFQGNLLISETNFIRHWPSVSGTHVMLISCKPEDAEPIQSEMAGIFRDYGIDLQPAAEKLAAFNSIENTYLSIFLVMGSLAMLLGTIGLAIILARNLQERQSEIAILRATGFSRTRILWLVVREYSALLLTGTLAGGLSSLLTVLPGLLNPASEVSSVFLILILATLVANGMLWILILGWNAVRKPGIVQSLRTE